MIGKKKKRQKKKIEDIDLMEELDYYQPKRKKQIDQKVILGAVLLVVVIAGILFSPLFEKFIEPIMIYSSSIIIVFE